MYNLWELRKRRKMSVSQLASRAGIPAHVLREYESGTRTILSRDLERLARALYVDPWDIKDRSDPPPELESKPFPEARIQSKKPVAEKRPPAKLPREKRARRPTKNPRKPKSIPPVRETQIEQMLSLGMCLGTGKEALVAKVGKPLEELNQLEAARILKDLTEQCKKHKGKKGTREQGMKRAHLPEGVDKFEMNYLQKCMDERCRLRVSMFDETVQEGVLIGFSPYTLTIEDDGGNEITLNKLAIAYYSRRGGSVK